MNELRFYNRIFSTKKILYKKNITVRINGMRKIIIVTGASSGLGSEFSKILAEETCNELWILARRSDLLENVKKQIEEKKVHPLVKPVTIDLSGIEGANNFNEILKAENAKEEILISYLVNNAGFGTYGEFANTDTEREMQMIDLDCTTLTGLTGYCLPFMKAGSRIINVASLASFMPLGNFAVYGACKAYVLSFSIALRAELKSKGITVTAVCPGPVDTNFANVASKGARVKVRHGMSAYKTALHAVKKAKQGKLYSLYAFKWKFKAFASHFVNKRLGAWFTYKFCKRPSN